MNGARDKSKMPDDFPTNFVELGRVGCELEYGVGRKRVVSYLEQSGRKEELIARREQYVRAKRQAEAQSAEMRRPQPNVEIDDDRAVDPLLAERAARHLQRSQSGGWVVYRCEDNRGHWVVGVRRYSAAQMVDMAIERGFDRARAERQIKAFGE